MSVSRLLRPLWLLTHLLVVSAMFAMVGFGVWQLRRLDDRQAQNAIVEERMAQQAGPLLDVVDLDDPEASVHLTVYASGAFDPGREIYVANRTLDGRPGVNVVTLFELDSGAVVVDRGFLPRRAYLGGEDSYWATPEGEVVVTGWLRTTRSSRGGLGDEVDVIDLTGLSERWGVSLLPVYIEATSGAVVADYPLVPRPPDLTDGPHLGYAIQWFVFALIALIGYPLVMVRIARDEPPGVKAS
ncbi:MAG TPA: SURF1 family protein [Acidimicrobiales bacterium]|nr:SURF1 family protein [Acidimicrobiales bacterium]HJL90342.1 SURF1 family protein [Acidimicrobiales bacterium]HJO99436.1 SURF1 family protein [Acidimicrobiales bacterium]